MTLPSRKRCPEWVPFHTSRGGWSRYPLILAPKKNTFALAWQRCLRGAWTYFSHKLYIKSFQKNIGFDRFRASLHGRRIFWKSQHAHKTTIICRNQKEMTHRRVPGKDHIGKLSPFWEDVVVFKRISGHEDLGETYQTLYFYNFLFWKLLI